MPLHTTHAAINNVHLNDPLQNFSGYIKAFDQLRTFKEKIGPMWPLEEDLWRSDNAEVKKLPEGFRFVISWMQNTQNMNLLPQVPSQLIFCDHTYGVCGCVHAMNAVRVHLSSRSAMNCSSTRSFAPSSF